MRKRRWGRRLAGVLFLLVLVELALQAAGPLVQRAMVRRGPDVSPDAALSILCVGDSNTFGLNVPEVSKYPERLRARLARRFREPVAVTNRGVPGHNSAQVLAALPHDLADTRADVVLVLVGINDTWNTGGEDRGLTGLLEQLKLVRLVRVLLAGVTTAGRFEVRTDAQGEIIVDRGDGAARVNTGASGTAVRVGAELEQRLRAGLGAILDTCADHGAVPVLMTYAEYQGEFAGINALIREVAQQRGVLLVDHERAFGERFAVDGYEALMLNDHHPNARGYQLMAEQVDAALVAAHWVPATELAGPAPDPADGAPLPPPTLLALDGARLRLAGPPGCAFQLLVARRPLAGQGFDVGPLRVPLPDDEVFVLSRVEPSFSGRFGAGGTLELQVPRRLLDTAGAAGASACLLLLAEPDADGATDAAPVRAISEVVDVRG